MDKERKYYFENTAGMQLSGEGRSVIREAIVEKKLVCSHCGERLQLMSFQDGDCVICPIEIYKHPNNWRVRYNYYNDTPPEIFEKN